MLHLALALAPLLSSATDPAPAELVPRARFFAPSTRHSAALSPDGRHVGWIDVAGGLWVAPTAEPDAARRVELGGAPRTFRFAHRPDVVLAVVAGEAGPLVVRAALAEDPDAPVELARFDGASSIELVGGSAARPDEWLVEVRGGEEAGLALVSLEGRAPERIGELGDFDRFWCDGELAVRAAQRVRPDAAGPDLFVRRGDEWVEVADWDWLEQRASGVLSVSADGRRLFLVDAAGRDRSALVALDLETLERELVYADPLADLVPAGATIDPRSGEVEAVVAYFGALRRRVLEPSLEPDFAVLEATLPGDLSYVDRSADGAVWLVRAMDGGPLDHYVYDSRTRRAHFVFTDVPGLEDVTLAPRTSRVVPARDGRALPCQLYLPPGSDADGDGIPDEPLPTVLYVHGGPWIGLEWNSWFTNRSFQLLAARGYAVLRVDFRGAAGYGREWLDAGDGEFGAAMIDDVIDAAGWTLEQRIARPGALALWGWSYGGYAVFQALARSPDTFACGLSMYGLSDLESFVERLIAMGLGDTWTQRVGDPRTEEGRALLRAQSPLHSADRIAAPLLVTHGARDDRAPIEHSERMVAALAERDHPVTYAVFPNEPHDYRSAASWIAFWAMAEAFLTEHLGGRAEPFGTDLASADFEITCGAQLVPGLADAAGAKVAGSGG